MARLLEVWLFSNHVGTLAQKQGRLSVTYAPAMLCRCHSHSRCRPTLSMIGRHGIISPVCCLKVISAVWPTILFST